MGEGQGMKRGEGPGGGPQGMRTPPHEAITACRRNKDVDIAEFNTSHCDGKAAENIKKILKTHNITNIVKKRFYNINFEF